MLFRSLRRFSNVRNCLGYSRKAVVHTTAFLSKAKSDGRIRDYDAWSRHNGYVWLRQPRADGQYGYLPCRNADSNEAFGKFELLS